MSGWNPIFSTLKTSSILIEGPDVVATWALFLADADSNGVSTLTVPYIAQVLFSGDLKRAQKAMDVLTSEDKHSKNKAYQGRRLIPVEEAGIDAAGPWFLPTHAEHRKRMQVQKEKNRVRQQRYREKKRREDALRAEKEHVISKDEAAKAFHADPPVESSSDEGYPEGWHEKTKYPENEDLGF